MAPGSRAAQSDPRWLQVVVALVALRNKRRHAIRIVDADCGAGTLLVAAVRHARSLGFTAIEGRGIDGSPAMIGRARSAAARLHDPAIGITFKLADMVAALQEEQEFPADIVLWHGCWDGDGHPGVDRALAAAADLVIGDPAQAAGGHRAA